MKSLTPLGAVLQEEGRRQTWLAERTGINPSDISRIVNGMNAPQAKREAISAALHRPVADLFPDHAGDPSTPKAADVVERQATAA